MNTEILMEMNTTMAIMAVRIIKANAVPMLWDTEWKKLDGPPPLSSPSNKPPTVLFIISLLRPMAVIIKKTVDASAVPPNPSMIPFWPNLYTNGIKREAAITVKNNIENTLLNVKAGEKSI